MKKLLVILMIVASQHVFAQYDDTISFSVEAKKPVVAVVLSGGGAKGVAHIGALKVIEEAGIPIDIVCGTSMGALVGGLYSMGYSTQFLDSLVRSQNWTALLSDRIDPSNLTLRQREEQNTYAFIRGLGGDQADRGGLIRGRNVINLLQRLTANLPDSIDFDSLPIRFACVATDIARGREVDIHSGNLVYAMRASMAIPGVFTPVRKGDMVLVDGGLSNNYPVDLARSMGADIVIGVNVQDPMAKADDIDDAFAVMGQIISITSRNKFNDNIKKSSIFIHVDVNGYGAASFTSSSIDTLLMRGENAARRVWNQLLALRMKNGIDSTGAMQPLTSFPNNDQPQPANRPTRVPVASAGMRFDSEEMGALQVNVKVPIPTTKVPMALSGTLRLGRRNLASVECTFLSNRTGFNPTLLYAFRGNDLDYYTAGSRNFNIRYRQHTVDLTPVDVRLRRYDLHMGASWNYYDYYGQLLSASDPTTTPSLDDNRFFSYHAAADRNTENDWYFPTRGSRIQAYYAYHTTNLWQYNGKAGISDIRFNWRTAIPLNRLFTLQPMFYTRLLFADNLPLALMTTAGGESFGARIEQQLPFAGMGHMELMQRDMAAFQIQLQMLLGKNHHLLLRAATGYQTDGFDQLSADGLLFGIQAGYSYSTIVGPLSARLGYCTHTHSPYLYISLGHIF